MDGSVEVVTTTRRKRKQASVLPQHINPIQKSEHPLYTTSTMTTVTKKSKEDDNKDSNDGRRSMRLPLLIRGQILSMQDDGCLVDLGHGQKGFCRLGHMLLARTGFSKTTTTIVMAMWK